MSVSTTLNAASTPPAIAFAVPPNPLNTRVRQFLPMAVIAAALLLSPVLVLAFRLWRSGDYGSQVYFWRSAPPGIDLVTLFLGNPLGFAPGPWTASVLDRLGITLPKRMQLAERELSTLAARA